MNISIRILIPVTQCHTSTQPSWVNNIMAAKHKDSTVRRENVIHSVGGENYNWQTFLSQFNIACPEGELNGILNRSVGSIKLHSSNQPAKTKQRWWDDKDDHGHSTGNEYRKGISNKIFHLPHFIYIRWKSWFKSF